MGIIEDQTVYDRVRSHIVNSGNNAVWAYKKTKDAEPHFDTGVCHYKVQTVLSSAKFDFFASCASWAANSPIYKASPGLLDYVQSYCRWIIGPESPWAKIHQNDIEPILDGRKLIRGFILGPKALETSPRGGIYNFLIAGRMTRDHTLQFMTYGKLKEEFGLDDCSAFLLSPYIQKKGIAWVHGPKYASTWNAGHTPLREIGPSGDLLDPISFRAGEYNDKKGTISLSSYGWLNRKTGVPISKEMEGAQEVLKTKFSSISCITKEKILEVARTL